MRDWTADDIEDLIEGLNNLHVSSWLAFVPFPYTINDANHWICYCVEISRQGPKRRSYEFAIELKSEQKIIGGVTLAGIDFFQGTAGGGIWINESYQGQGYATEAFGERIRFAFTKLNLRRLENGYFEGNTASQKMQERFGYKIEGMRRQGLRCMADGKVKNEYITGTSTSTIRVVAARPNTSDVAIGTRNWAWELVSVNSG